MSAAMPVRDGKYTPEQLEEIRKELVLNLQAQIRRFHAQNEAQDMKKRWLTGKIGD